MKKTLSFFAMLILVSIFAVNLFAQPQYYNNTTGINNSIPLNTAGGQMIQTLIAPGEFSNPSPATAGNITSLFIRIGEALGPATYTDFKILMGQTTDVVLTGGAFYPGTMTQVFSRASVTYTAAGASWLEIPLDVPFAYNPAQSLVIQIEQRGATGTITGYSLSQSSIPSRRIYSAGGYPWVYGGIQDRVTNCGLTIAPPVTAPELIYYKFEDNPSTTTIKNCASAPVGTNPATLASLTLGTGGQFDTCVVATGVASGGVTTGWNCDLAASSWTISMWLTIPSSASGSAYYLFGDPGAGSFRCFHNGVAGQDNLVLRGTGITDVTVTGIGPAPTVVTFVYDATIPDIKAYKNGVLAVTVSQTALNLTVGSGFKVGGYSTSANFIGQMDEFRLYNRALDAAEVGTAWNQDIACTGSGVGITQHNNTQSFDLLQNYPNPFNQNTTIAYQLSANSNVVLKVYDIMGKEVSTLVNKTQTAGKYEVKFDASNLSAGIYVYQLTTNNNTLTKRMMIEK